VGTRAGGIEEPRAGRARIPRLRARAAPSSISGRTTTRGSPRSPAGCFSAGGGFASPCPSRPNPQFEPAVAAGARARVPSERGGARGRARVPRATRSSISGRTTTRGAPRAPGSRSCSRRACLSSSSCLRRPRRARSAHAHASSQIPRGDASRSAWGACRRDRGDARGARQDRALGAPARRWRGRRGGFGRPAGAGPRWHRRSSRAARDRWSSGGKREAGHWFQAQWL